MKTKPSPHSKPKMAGLEMLPGMLKGVPHNPDKRIKHIAFQGHDAIHAAHADKAQEVIDRIGTRQSNDYSKPAVADAKDKAMNGVWAPGDELPDDAPNKPYRKK